VSLLIDPCTKGNDIRKIMLKRSAGMVLQLALKAKVLIIKCSEELFTQSAKFAG